MWSAEFRWAYPAAFLLFLLLPVLPWLIRRLNRRSQGVAFPAVFIVRSLTKESHQYVRHLPIVMRLLLLALLVFIVARPQTVVRSVDKKVESLDVLLVLDLSESMRADDIRPNRLAVAKQVLKRFIQKRPNDRMGLVVFSGTPLTLAPLTLDHGSIGIQLESVHTNTVGVEGTAMGEALLMAVNRLLDERAPSAGQTEMIRKKQIIILATDGVNNMGAQPALAASILREKGMKLYTIGLGGKEQVIRYTQDYFGNPIVLRDVYGRKQYWDRPDEKALQELAAVGGGKYFHAHSQEAFENVMDEIDGLEKNLVSLDRSRHFQEKYFWLLCAALFLLAADVLLRSVRFRSVVI